MDKPLKLILLVDDDEATNFLHKIMINDAECAEHIHVSKNGKEALAYLTHAIEGKYPQPDLIFLDINMPVMNGWEFLDQYLKSGYNEIFPEAKLIVLSSTIDPQDVEKTKNYPMVVDFLSKPITKEMIEELKEKAQNKK